MAGVAAALALIYAVVDAFSAWALSRRRRRLAMGFMAGATLLVVAGVAVAFGQPAALPLAVAGATTSLLVSLAEDGGARTPDAWMMPRLLRLVAGATVVVAMILARPPLA